MGSEDALLSLLYFVTIVTSLGAAGETAEQCADREDVLKCSERVNAFMAFGFLTAFVAIPLLVAYVADIPMIKRFEIFISPVIVLFAIIACALGTSSKSESSTVSSLIVWYSLMSASAAMFLALKNVRESLPRNEKNIDPAPVSVPMTGPGSVASSIPMQPVHPATVAPTQPIAMPYSAPSPP